MQPAGYGWRLNGQRLRGRLYVTQDCDHIEKRTTHDEGAEMNVQ